MATKKATKSSKKKASKKKVASKKKAPAKKAAIKQKVATKKAVKKTARKVVAKKAAVKKVAKKAAVKRVRPSRSKAAIAARQQASQASIAPPNTRPCFKVLVQRGDKLQSIYAKGVLRLTYSDEHFTNAPHESLPITAFSSHSDAQRFIDRNRRKREQKGLKSPWLLVKGEGVVVSPPRSRMVGINQIDQKTVTDKLVSQITAVTSQEAPPRRPRRGSNWRREYKGRNWSQGTIFLSCFKISK